MAQGSTRNQSLCVYIFSITLSITFSHSYSCGQIFHKRMPPEAVDLVSRLLQYSPNLRCTAVSINFPLGATPFCLGASIIYLLHSYTDGCLDPPLL